MRTSNLPDAFIFTPNGTRKSARLKAKEGVPQAAYLYVRPPQPEEDFISIVDIFEQGIAATDRRKQLKLYKRKVKRVEKSKITGKGRTTQPIEAAGSNKEVEGTTGKGKKVRQCHKKKERGRKNKLLNAVALEGAIVLPQDSRRIVEPQDQILPLNGPSLSRADKECRKAGAELRLQRLGADGPVEVQDHSDDAERTAAEDEASVRRATKDWDAWAENYKWREIAERVNREDPSRRFTAITCRSIVENLRIRGDYEE
ncbi:hypothetical protein RUND412_010176 [Rhizina undulata]